MRSAPLTRSGIHGKTPSKYTRPVTAGFSYSWMIVILFLLNTAMFELSAQNTDGVGAVEAHLQEAGYAVFRDESISSAAAALNRSDSALGELSPQVEENHPVFRYYQSRIYLNRGFILMSAGRDREAQEYLEKSIELSQKALELIDRELQTRDSEGWEHGLNIPALPEGRGIHSDLWRVLSDSYMYLFNFKGTLYQMSNGAKLRDYPQNALALNPENLRARLSRGLFFINAPAIGGGNDTKGIETLEYLLNSENDLLRFQGLAWIGTAHLEEGNTQDAQDAFDAAERIFPDTAWIDGLRSGESSRGR